MRKSALSFAVLVTALLSPAAASAQGGACPNVPTSAPLFLEYADGTVKWRNEVFAQPGVTTSMYGNAVGQGLRAGGGGTTYWENSLANLTKGDPVANASSSVQTAAQQSACATPYIALNEFQGSNFTGQYAQNVLAVMQNMQALGARPFLLIPGSSARTTAPGAAAFFTTAAQYGDLVHELYFDAKAVNAQGPVLGSRNTRIAFRGRLGAFQALGIPRSKQGMMLGFQSGTNAGGREGLQPTAAWLGFVKLQSLAAQQVSKESAVGSIWSWGWGTFAASGSADADKQIAACTYLWSRDANLCNAPSQASFNTSLTEGQLNLSPGVHCSFTGGKISTAQVRSWKRIAGGVQPAINSLFETAVVKQARKVPGRSISAAERAIIKARFKGSRSAYTRRLKRSKISRKTARTVIVTLLAEKSLGAAGTTAAQTKALLNTTCVLDQVPATNTGSVTKTLTFLKLASAKKRSK